ncbi:MAG: DUF1326 domain-containing protein [Candidatus Hydrogenedentes bacterium]|nr:DUF1326 domain-containing protein [Candidatus Hydrogenedentota bacterium]
MSNIEWSLKGPSFSNCNCDWGCPCQFNALPTHGHCNALTAMRIDEGHFGGVRLDGLCWVGTFKWPGPIHEGNGTAQVVIDERADSKQRAAILSILAGEHTEPGATIFQVFAAMITNMHDPLFLPIEFECDVDARTAHVKTDGFIAAKGEPILNPVTGQPHRISLTMPNGFEYHKAEVGMGTTRTSGAVKLDLRKSHGHFAHYHMTHKGVVH